MKTILLLSLSFSWITAVQAVDDKSVTNDSIYFSCDKKPEYLNSESKLIKFISDSLIYPESSLAQGIQGKVVVRLIIEKDGTIEEAEVLLSPDSLLSQEAIRVLSLTSGKWEAGVVGGKKVRSYFTMPVVFKIKEEPVYLELKSDNPADCPPKKAEYIGGADEFRNFIADNLYNLVTDTKEKGRTVVRVVREKRKVKKSNKESNNLEEIQALEIETTKIDYVTRGEIASMSLGIRSRPYYPAVIIGSEKITGNTLVCFIIEKDGMVSNVKIIETKYDKPKNPDNIKLIQEFETEIIRMIYLSAGKWIPAEMNCEVVRIYLTIPVNWKYITRPIVA
jgi:protein TonB